MTNNRFVTCFLALLSVSFQTKLKAQEDHLEPVTSVFDLYGFEYEYSRHVRKILYTDNRFNTEASLLIIPAFSSENLLLIKRNDKTGTRWLVNYKAEKNIWYALYQLKDGPNDEIETPDISTIKTTVGLSKSDSQLLIDLFTTALKQTKPREVPVIGADGATYYFTVSKLAITGRVWSPQNETDMRELVDIGLELVNLVRKSDGSEVINLSPRLLQRTKTLIKKLSDQTDN